MKARNKNRAFVFLDVALQYIFLCIVYIRLELYSLNQSVTYLGRKLVAKKGRNVENGSLFALLQNWPPHPIC